MIATYKDVAFSASAHAPRFKVLAGEALIVDNCARTSLTALGPLDPQAHS